MRSTSKSRVMCCLALAFIAFAGLAVGLNGSKAEASTVTFDLDKVFSGTPPQAHVQFWLTATFADTATDEVTLTMNTGRLVRQEFVGEWFFNFDIGLNPDDLTINHVLGPQADLVDTGIDSFQVVGDGYFDIKFSFAAHDFARGWDSVYTLTGEDIKASSFNYWSNPGGGQGAFLSAAHVQGIGKAANKSGWICAVVPIPTSALLLGSGLMGLIAIRRRKGQGSS